MNMRMTKKFKSNMGMGLKFLFFLVLLVSLFSLNLYSGTPCDKGLATLSISVSAIDEPCKIENTRSWFITIFNCDGTVLEFCGRSYILIPAKCGCLDVDVPPGCYYIKAVWNFWIVTPGLVYWVNHFTDAAIVQACCEKTTCVRLFNPSLHRCGYIYRLAVNDLIKQNAIKGDIGNRVTGAIEAVNKEIPAPKNMFELGIEKEIEELMQKQRREEK
jgi:hypothetical protein